MIITSDELFKKAVEILKPLDLSLKDYEEICDSMGEAMAMGLKKSTSSKSSIKMFPSYVTKIPNRNITGSFLALDLGGTNYRVLSVTFSGNGVQPEIDERTYGIPKEKMTGTGQQLFRYIAETLSNFLDSHGLSGRHYDLGFTFSFPCQQKGLAYASLVRWTKGFTATDVEGKNVAELLQNEIDKVGLDVTCVAVVNDTVGTLAACALSDPKCCIGLIVGTGTNAAYIESCSNIELDDKSSDSHMIINTEWGAFGEMGELDKWRTRFDKSVDMESLHPGKQLYEKMVSGMYLGELVRHILLYLTEQKLLFGGHIPESIRIKGKLLTKYLTDVEHDPQGLTRSTHYMLTEDLSIPVVEPTDDRIVRYVCELVAKRAASLAGVGIVCLIKRMGRPEATVGVDGSLYNFHPKFRQNMTLMVDTMLPEIGFCFRASDDGSGKGAAAIAAAASL